MCLSKSFLLSLAPIVQTLAPQAACATQVNPRAIDEFTIALTLGGRNWMWYILCEFIPGVTLVLGRVI